MLNSKFKNRSKDMISEDLGRESVSVFRASEQTLKSQPKKDTLTVELKGIESASHMNHEGNFQLDIVDDSGPVPHEDIKSPVLNKQGSFRLDKVSEGEYEDIKPPVLNKQGSFRLDKEEKGPIKPPSALKRSRMAQDNPL